MNFGDDGYDVHDMQGFAVSVSAEFYPQLNALYRQRIDTWAAEHRVDAEDDE